MKDKSFKLLFVALYRLVSDVLLRKSRPKKDRKGSFRNAKAMVIKMKITYLGQMCYLIETGNIRIVTDPYLSNSCDSDGHKRKYAPPTTLCELMPDIIIISHDHKDHLDPMTLMPFYRLRRRSFTLVPEPISGAVEAIGGEAVPMSAPEAAKLGESFRLGGVTVTALPAAHAELHRKNDGGFCELSYLIEAERKKIFFGGDMSIYAGLLESLCDISPDVMILPVNGRDWFRSSRGIVGNLDSNEAAELAVCVGASMLIPGHHDLYEDNGCPDAWIECSSRKFGAPLRLLKPGETAILETNTDCF